MTSVESVLRAYERIQLACRGRRVAPAGGGTAVSETQARILSNLDDTDPVMVGELAEHLGVTASTMSLNLKRLEARGLVRRDRDPSDGRVINVRLTESGVEVRDAREVLDPMRVHDLLHVLGPEERRRAVEGLALLARAADHLVREGGVGNRAPRQEEAEG